MDVEQTAAHTLADDGRKAHKTRQCPSGHTCVCSRDIVYRRGDGACWMYKVGLLAASCRSKIPDEGHALIDAKWR